MMNRCKSCGEIHDDVDIVDFFEGRCAYGHRTII
jgi:hypothetical protein